MGRNRIEDQFKDKLVYREITPSAGSWEKLSGKLNSEEKKGKPLIWWIGIAATLLGAIFITNLVYNINYQPDNLPVVETPVNEINDTRYIPEPLVSPKNLSEGIVNENRTFKEKPSAGNNKKATIIKPKMEVGLVENAPPTNNSEESSISQIVSADTPIKGGTAEQEVGPAIANDPQVAFEVNNILAEIAQLEKNNGKLEDVEINALLAQAATQISKNRQERFSSGKIDAEALLWDVQMGMEESFREKVFEVIKEGYLRARTAVVNRNN